MNEVEARKIEMSQVFREDGRVIPVTLVKLEKIPKDLVAGSAVKVVGTSKGKGFAGVMKRHGFSGMPATHGTSTYVRAPGSIGGGTTPGRVYKGKKMAGRMGGNRVTVKGLSVIEIDEKNKVVKIFGSIPGPRKSKILLQYEPEEANAKNAQEVVEAKDIQKAEENGEIKEAKGTVVKGEEDTQNAS